MSAPNSPPVNVLVVDDDVEIREIVQEVLEDAGYRVRIATNGEEALAELRRAQLPAIILLDLMMPVMDGGEFRRRQLADSALDGIPVVVCSASGTLDQQARDMRAVAVLRKPFSLDKLLATVARFAR